MNGTRCVTRRDPGLAMPPRPPGVEGDWGRGGRPGTALEAAGVASLLAPEACATLVETTGIGLVLISAASDSILWINRSGADLFGLAAGEMIGRRVTEFYVHPDDRQPLELRADTGIPVDRAEVLLSSATGRQFWALVSICPAVFQGERIQVSSVVDISRYKLREISQVVASQRAESALISLRMHQTTLVASERSDAFAHLLAGLGEELSAPVGDNLTQVLVLESKICNMWTLMTEKPPPRAQIVEFLSAIGDVAASIATSMRRTAAMVDTFKRLGCRSPRAGRPAATLRSVIDSALSALEPELGKSGVWVEIECPGTLDLPYRPRVMAQVLINLIRNSLMHAYPEGRQGRLRITGRRLPGGGLEVRHEDDGIGIPEHQLARVFEPFFTTATERGATGVGLTISRTLVVEQLGGTLDIESRPGSGTTVTLHLERPSPS